MVSTTTRPGILSGQGQQYYFLLLNSAAVWTKYIKSDAVMYILPRQQGFCLPKGRDLDQNLCTCDLLLQSF